MLQILYRFGALIAFVITLAVCAWYIGSIRTELRISQDAVIVSEKKLKKAQDTMLSRANRRDERKKETEVKSASLANVLEKNPVWAETPVPKEVQDDLCKTIRCVPGAADSVRGAASSANVGP